MYRIMGIETSYTNKETIMKVILQDTETKFSHKIPLPVDLKKEKDNILDYIETMLPIQKEKITWPKYLNISMIPK